jgi:hypothetical protein
MDAGLMVSVPLWDSTSRASNPTNIVRRTPHARGWKVVRIAESHDGVVVSLVSVAEERLGRGWLEVSVVIWCATGPSKVYWHQGVTKKRLGIGGSTSSSTSTNDSVGGGVGGVKCPVRE